jgi:hypothetical protein
LESIAFAIRIHHIIIKYEIFREYGREKPVPFEAGGRRQEAGGR